jgi:hypothetical protein
MKQGRKVVVHSCLCVNDGTKRRAMIVRYWMKREVVTVDVNDPIKKHCIAFGSTRLVFCRC